MERQGMARGNSITGTLDHGDPGDSTYMCAYGAVDPRQTSADKHVIATQLALACSTAAFSACANLLRVGCNSCGTGSGITGACGVP